MLKMMMIILFFARIQLVEMSLTLDTGHFLDATELKFEAVYNSSL